jgi:hypothetical protein
MAKALTLLPRECQLYRTGKARSDGCDLQHRSFCLDALGDPVPYMARSDILFLRFGTWLHKAASAGCMF